MSGKVYSCGNSEFGQCGWKGREPFIDGTTVSLIRFPTPNIYKTSDGLLICEESDTEEDEPQAVESGTGERDNESLVIAKIAAGSKHSLFLSTCVSLLAFIYWIKGVSSEIL